MSNTSPDNARDSIILSIIRSNETDNSKIVLCDSLESDGFRAEICLLRQKLTQCEVTIQRLVQIVATMVDKQNEIIDEVVELRNESRAAPMTPPPEIETLPSVQNGTPELDDSLPDSDSDDWHSLVPLLSSWVRTPFTPPQSRRRISGLDRIEEEEEEVEDSSLLAPVSQI